MNISHIAYNNAILNLRECRDKLPILSSYPMKLYIEPTKACNLKCTYCYPPEEHLAKRLDMEIFYAIEKQLFSHACEVNLFLSGEPVLHKNFSEMLEICSRYSFITKLFSSLSYVNDFILRKMVETGSWVNVSLDHYDNNTLRDGCDTELVIRNIIKLQNFQNEIRNDKFYLRIATVVGKHNVTSLCSLIDWVASMGISEIMLGCLDASPRISQYGLTPDDALYFEQAVYRADLLGIRISTPSHICGVKITKTRNWEDFSLGIDSYFPFFCEDCNPDVENSFCPYPWIQAVIGSEGEVVSCCQRKIPLGIFTPNTDFISDIWNNKSFQEIRSLGNYKSCKNPTGSFCNMIGYSIWGGELRLNNIPEILKAV